MNVGNDAETCVKELAEMIVSLTNSNSKIKFLPPLKEGDMTRRKPDITKMKSILGRDLTQLRDGLQRTLDNKMF
jgi:UDP-glucose 4-epimerase